MEPAHSIIKLFGGPEAVRKITGTAITAPYRWQSSVEKGGTGGHIPPKHYAALLEASRDRGLGLRPEHLIIGVPEDVLKAAEPEDVTSNVA